MQIYRVQQAIVVVVVVAVVAAVNIHLTASTCSPFIPNLTNACHMLPLVIFG